MAEILNDIVFLLLIVLFDTRYNWAAFGCFAMVALICALSLLGLRSIENQKDTDDHP